MVILEEIASVYLFGAMPLSSSITCGSSWPEHAATPGICFAQKSPQRLRIYALAESKHISFSSTVTGSVAITGASSPASAASGAAAFSGSGSGSGSGFLLSAQLARFGRFLSSGLGIWHGLVLGLWLWLGLFLRRLFCSSLRRLGLALASSAAFFSAASHLLGSCRLCSLSLLFLLYLGHLLSRWSILPATQLLDDLSSSLPKPSVVACLTRSVNHGLGHLRSGRAAYAANHTRWLISGATRKA